MPVLEIFASKTFNKLKTTATVIKNDDININNFVTLIV